MNIQNIFLPVDFCLVKSVNWVFVWFRESALDESQRCIFPVLDLPFY